MPPPMTVMTLMTLFYLFSPPRAREKKTKKGVFTVITVIHLNPIPSRALAAADRVRGNPRSVNSLPNRWLESGW